MKRLTNPQRKDEDMKTKSLYRVFDWNGEYEETFDTLEQAEHYYKEQVETYPNGNWRLYQDTEKPYLSGNFTEECLKSNRIESEG